MVAGSLFAVMPDRVITERTEIKYSIEGVSPSSSAIRSVLDTVATRLSMTSKSSRYVTS